MSPSLHYGINVIVICPLVLIFLGKHIQTQQPVILFRYFDNILYMDSSHLTLVLMPDFSGHQPPNIAQSTSVF